MTDAEKTTVLAQWLDWIKQSVPGLNVERIMIGCSATEIAAIKCTFGDDVQILLCHWHIKRAWKTHLKKEAYLTYLLCYLLKRWRSYSLFCRFFRSASLALFEKPK